MVLNTIILWLTLISVRTQYAPVRSLSGLGPEMIAAFVNLAVPAQSHKTAPAAGAIPSAGATPAGGAAPAGGADPGGAPADPGGAAPAGPGGEGCIFDITKFGAKPNCKTDNALPIIKAWNAACKSTGGPPKLVIPAGDFLTGEIVFVGPCTAPKPITIELNGNLLSDPDLSLYTANSWIRFEHVDGLVITGSGTFNGQGEKSWKQDGCKGDDCGGSGNGHLPDSVVFEGTCNAIVTKVKFLNSKGFHMKITSKSNNFVVDDVCITAPENSPNTDGIHISKATNVTITNSLIQTGDDCVSIGDGNLDIFVNKVRCGPGHGISIGSLGKRETETDVKNIVVTNCTLTKTTNGARIKSFRESPKLLACGIIFEDIIMEDVHNPIIIDQNYESATRSGGSNVKLSDIHFRNIRGTTVSPVGVALNCSSSCPCDGVELVDIDLCFTGDTARFPTFTSACANTKPVFNGKMNPPACAA